MKLLFFLLRTSRGKIALIVLASLLGGLCSAGFIALTNTALHNAERWGTTLIWAFGLLGLTMIITQALSRDLLIRFSQKSIAGLRRDLTHKVLTTPLRRLEKMGAPRILATITGDVQSIAAALADMPGFIQNVALSVGCSIYLAWLSPAAFLWTAGTIGLGIIIFRLLLARALYYWKLARSEQDILFRHFRALTEGTKELKMHKNRLKAFLSQNIHATTDSLERFHVAAVRHLILAGTSNQFIFVTVTGLVLFALPTLQNISSETLTGYVLIILYLMGTLRAFMNSFQVFGQAKISLERVEELGLSLATPSPEQEQEMEPQPCPVLSWDRLDLEGVVYTYHRENDQNDFVLGPIDLVLRPGELVFLVGGNGSGKSTFAKLFTGLYTPEAGEIRVDGQSITNANREWYRQHFSVVFSDFYLFETLLGLDTPDLESHARDYLKQFELGDRVQIENGAFSTTDLSLGQRKRLALLTAYLEDRPIYVLDEWAAEQDREFREIFYTQLLPELKAKGKTVLVISHDDRYYHLADRILKFDYGQVASSLTSPVVSSHTRL